MRLRLRSRLLAVVVAVGLLGSGFVVLSGRAGWIDGWLDRLGRSEPAAGGLGRVPVAPSSAVVPVASGGAPVSLSVEEWGRRLGEEVRAKVEAEPAERVLSPSTRLVRSGPGRYVFEDLGRAAFRSDGKGGWEPVSLEPMLSPSGPVAVSYGGTTVPTSFGRGGGSVVIFDVDGHQVRLTPSGLSTAEPEVDGELVTYREVAAATDLKYRVQGDGVKEFVVLRDSSAPRRFSFHMADPDGVLGDPVTEGDGSLVWSGTGMTDKRVAIPPAYAYASDVNGFVDPVRAVPGERHATMSAVRAGDGWDLTLGVDEAWYATQDGPVTLDPSIHYWYAYGRPGYYTWGTGASYSGSLAKTDGWPCNPQNCPGMINNTYYVAAGTNSAPYNDQFRTLIGWNYNKAFASHRYDYAPSPGMNVPLRAQINDGGTRLNLAGMYNQGCMAGSPSTAPGVYCYPQGSSFTLHNLKAPVNNSTTWANVRYGPSLAEAAATVPTDYFNDHFFQGRYNSFRVKPLLQEWVNDPDRAYGLMIKSKDGQENETPKGAWWASSTHGAPSGYNPRAYQPFLTVDFNETAPDWSNKTAVATPTTSGSTVSMRGTETDTGTYGIWYASVLVDADTGTVVRGTPTSDLRAGGNLDWQFADVPPGRYYTVQFGWNKATDSSGNPAYGWTKSKLFGVSGDMGQAGGAGREAWWSFEDKTIGPNAVAGVNVGNGNLVVQHADATPVQGHGRLSLGLERAYNSNAPDTIGLSNVGRGWSFVTSGVGDGVIDGVGLTVDPLGLSAQPVTLVDRDGTRHAFSRNQTNLQIAIGDKTLTGVTLGSDPLASLLGPGDQVGGLIKGLVDSVNGTLRRPDGTVNDLFSGGVRVCVDTSYNAPSGVNLSLWRFVGVALGTSCPDTSVIGAAPPVVLGYATVSPDRVRTLYSLSGRLSSVIDPAGNELRYEYGIVSNILGLNGLFTVLQTPLSQLRRVYDPRTCDPLDLPSLVNIVLPLLPVPGCRQITFHYPLLFPALGSTVVTDAAGRTVTYHTDLASQTLSRVETKAADAGPFDPPLEVWSYTYQGLNGLSLADCGGTPGQMCSATAPNGKVTKFSYQNGKIATVTDRAGPDETSPEAVGRLTASFAYNPATADAGPYTDVTQDGRARRYANIDSSLRVAEISAGSPAQLAAGTALSRVSLVWDGSGPGGAVCQPAADSTGSRLNHNLCQTRTTGGGLDTANAPGGYIAPGDQIVDFEYTPEGYVLKSSRHLDDTARLETTNRYLVSVYKLGQATPVQSTEGFGAPNLDRPGDTKYVVVDRTATRSPAGNLTFFDVDADPVVPMGTVGAEGPGGTRVCGQKTRTAQTQTGGGNTGLACHVRAPAVPTPGTPPGPGAGPEGPRVTGDPDPYKVEVESRTYDGFGQKRFVTDPTGATAQYKYYTDSQLDLTGNVSAGGWLRSVTDPAGAFVTFAYDRAGNVARTWDRNATKGMTETAFDPRPENLDNPPSPRYTETQMAAEANPRAAFANPWRYPTKTRTAKGEITKLTVDAHGNTTQTETPLGFKTVREFNARDGLTVEKLPATPGTPSRFTYDGERRLTSATDAEGHVVTAGYDPAGRRSQTRFTRGPWAQASNREKEGGCQESTAADSPIPVGRTMCTTRTTYSGTGQPVAVTDASGVPAWTSYDRAGRVTDTWAFRSEGRWLRSSQALDGDGKVLTACTARQPVKEPTVPCGPNAHYATHTTFDGLSRPTKVVTHRERVGATGTLVTNGGQQVWDALESRQEYDPQTRTIRSTDPRGTVTTTRIDDRGRKAETVQPRAAALAVTTTWGYDPAGNTTSSTVRLGDTTEAVTAWRYDENNRLVDTVEAASSIDAAADQDTYRAVTTPSTSIANLRTRNYYDPDGRQVGTLDSRAFTSNVTTPDLSYLVRTDLDGNSRPIAQWSPMWNEQAAKPLDGGPERTECPMISPSTPQADRPQEITGVPSYPVAPAGVGVCVQRADYYPTGRLKTTTSPTRDPEQFQLRTWTDDGLLKSIEAPNPNLTDPTRPRILTERHEYDGVGRQVRTLDAVPYPDSPAYGYATDTTWFGDGLADTITSSKPGGPVDHQQSFKYDENGKPIETTTLIRAGVTETTESNWYADGLQYQQTSPAPNRYVNRWAYDPNGNPTSIWSPSAVATAPNNTAGTPITHTYTADNLLERTVEPVSPSGSVRRATDYTYDGLGRKKSQRATRLDGGGSVDGGTQSFSWSPNGWGLTEGGRSGGLISREFDAAGQLSKVVDQEAASTVTVEVSRLLNGGATKVKTSGADVTATRFSWHADGLQSRLEAGTGDMATVDSVQSTEYSDARLPVATTTSGWGGNSGWTAAKYDQAGRLLERVDPNGRVTSWGWFDDSQPKSSTVTDSLGVLDRWEVKARDMVGRATSVERQLRGKPTAQVRGFAYDGEGRVLPAEGKAVGWDPDGNRKQYGDPVGHGADGSLSAGTYDPAGNLTGSGCRTNTFDGFDRLRSTSGCGKPQVDYTYDGLDRQATVVTAGSGPGSGTRKVRYVGTSDTVLAEEHSDPSRTARYLLGADGAALGVVDGTGARQVLHTDLQGNTVLATTASGVEVCEARFNAWGEPEADSGCLQPGKTSNSRWYNGDRADETTGTYQNGSRTYDPAQATWLSADGYRTAQAGQDLSVSVDPLTQNRYSYVNGDPVNLHDPDGHKFSWKKFAHLALDVAGVVPVIGEIADLANCAFYAVEGNMVDAALSCASAIPIAGYAATAAKAAKHVDEAIAAGKAVKELAEKKLAKEAAERLAREKAAKEAAEKARREAAEKAQRELAQKAEAKARAEAAERANAKQATAQRGESAKTAVGRGAMPSGPQGGNLKGSEGTAGSIRRVNPLGGTQNCVNCAIATDATLSGHPASALGSRGPKPISVLEQTFGSAFKPVSGADEIQQLLLEAGPGARGIVFGSRGADPGHVFNAVNQRGVVRFLDGQSGGVASFEGFDAFHFLRTDV